MAHIIGTKFNDNLTGSYFTSDLIEALAANDTLDGAGGFDTLFGDTGADRFNVYAIDYNSRGVGYALIADFSWKEGDKLNIYSSGTSITYGVVGVVGNETEIYSNSDLIAVVRGDFNYALDASVF